MQQPPPAGASVQGFGRPASRPRGVCACGAERGSPLAAAPPAIALEQSPALWAPHGRRTGRGREKVRLGVITIHCQEGRNLESSSGEQQLGGHIWECKASSSSSTTTTSSSLTREHFRNHFAFSPCLGQRDLFNGDVFKARANSEGYRRRDPEVQSREGLPICRFQILRLHLYFHLRWRPQKVFMCI
ncbi:hypothetical protein MC885_012980, partial [Smutsia gigantea]